jgi:hypothetical protein
VPDASAFEKLGAFYLGRVVGEDGRVSDAPLLYDSRDLTTHAVCVGMTGSGKTGLCIALLEEAAIDGVPALAIDPKGDLANLLLGFPALEPADFRPWIDEAEALREGRTPDEHARAVAERWRRGLAESGQDGARIARLHEAVEMRLYTPGLAAGRPLSVLRSLAAPAPATAADADALRDRVQAAAAGLLALVGVEADPLRSREQILLANVLEGAWRAGRSLELEDLIREVQSPPFERVGVFDLETFFPGRERMAFAMTLNTLLASPGLAAWREGEPLDVARLLSAPDGRPRLSILSIAHLADAERMFFVTWLLAEVLAFVRAQPGTQSLRAIVYMDEVFGYLPPTANPPSKTPLLTLLKQARAFGVGVVLATQNPVDLDYKALSNAGTWLLGRLQTQRDQARVLDGLEGAAPGPFDRAAFERVLAGLPSRVFLLHDVHAGAPRRFQSRFTLSYLRGPLTPAQLRTLAREREPEATAEARTAAAERAAPQRAAHFAPAGERPLLPPDLDERFAAPALPRPEGATLLYRPSWLGRVVLHYVDAKRGVDHVERAALLAPCGADPPGRPWEGALRVGADALVLGAQPAAADARFAPPAPLVRRPGAAAAAARALADHARRDLPLRLLAHAALGATQRPDEDVGAFRVRLRELAHERRDVALEKLRARFAPRLERLRERLRRSEDRLEREQEQYRGQTVQAAISVGATVLGALLGRRAGGASSVGRATTAARGAQRAARERGDVRRAAEDVETARTELAELEARFEGELAAVRAEIGPEALACEERLVRASARGVEVESVALVWLPVWLGSDGSATPAVPT